MFFFSILHKVKPIWKWFISSSIKCGLMIFDVGWHHEFHHLSISVTTKNSFFYLINNQLYYFLLLKFQTNVNTNVSFTFNQIAKTKYLKTNRQCTFFRSLFFFCWILFCLYSFNQSIRSHKYSKINNKFIDYSSNCLIHV